MSVGQHVLVPTGEEFDFESADVPAPESKKGPQKAHEWIAIVQYRLSEGDLKAQIEQGKRLKLDRESINGPPMIGCFQCEVAFGPDLLGTVCPGEPPGELRWVPEG